MPPGRVRGRQGTRRLGGGRTGPAWRGAAPSNTRIGSCGLTALFNFTKTELILLLLRDTEDWLLYTPFTVTITPVTCAFLIFHDA